MWFLTEKPLPPRNQSVLHTGEHEELLDSQLSAAWSPQLNAPNNKDYT